MACPHALAIDIQGNFDLLGQVRDGDQSRDTEAPANLYGDTRISGLWARSNIDTFFRLQHDFARDDGATDFYAGYAHVPGAVPGVDITAGRQFLSEGPGSVYVADAGKIRIDPGWPVSFTVYGGAPRYFEPTYSTNIISQDEVLFGGNMRTKRWNGGQVAVGFQQLERKQRVLQQLVTGTATQSLSGLPGMPDLYGSIAYDADRQNLDEANAGVNFFLTRPRLMLNLAGTYYKPQDQSNGVVQTDLNRREDSIFELFSVSDLLQFRGGMSHPLTRTLSVYGDYSYQRYQSKAGKRENGHLGHVGLAWLPGGDGLESVRLEYYVADSGGGNVNGVDASYQNQVYQRIVFRTMLGVAYYDKRNNTSDVPVSSLVGLGYVLLPGLIGELNFEANRNNRFAEDFRFGFAISYNFQHRMDHLPFTGDRS